MNDTDTLVQPVTATDSKEYKAVQRTLNEYAHGSGIQLTVMSVERLQNKLWL